MGVRYNVKPGYSRTPLSKREQCRRSPVLEVPGAIKKRNPVQAVLLTRADPAVCTPREGTTGFLWMTVNGHSGPTFNSPGRGVGGGYLCWWQYRDNYCYAYFALAVILLLLCFTCYKCCCCCCSKCCSAKEQEETEFDVDQFWSNQVHVLEAEP